ncbi:unnamed protein product [Prorocentrum cordatum]|uniref:Uncharacterized protein n=1 Tax=Prorocentrum cordatum TaxID=2364126 RepID=A0ABN9TED6_9DINO|nr:unnamed protein product [Polarella glacialis]
MHFDYGLQQRVQSQLPDSATIAVPGALVWGQGRWDGPINGVEQVAVGTRVRVRARVPVGALEGRLQGLGVNLGHALGHLLASLGGVPDRGGEPACRVRGHRPLSVSQGIFSKGRGRREAQPSAVLLGEDGSAPRSSSARMGCSFHSTCKVAGCGSFCLDSATRSRFQSSRICSAASLPATGNSSRSTGVSSRSRGSMTARAILQLPSRAFVQKAFQSWYLAQSLLHILANDLQAIVSDLPVYVLSSWTLSSMAALRLLRPFALPQKHPCLSPGMSKISQDERVGWRLQRGDHVSEERLVVVHDADAVRQVGAAAPGPVAELRRRLLARSESDERFAAWQQAVRSLERQVHACGGGEAGLPALRARWRELLARGPALRESRQAAALRLMNGGAPLRGPPPAGPPGPGRPRRLRAKTSWP